MPAGQADRYGDHTIFVGEVVVAYVEETSPGRLVNFGGFRYALAEIACGTLYETQQPI